MRMSKSALAKTEAPHHTTTSHMTPPSTAKPAAASASSSYAPGVNILPHPPYPVDAQSRGQTGTVVMYVMFDAQGNVTHAEVSESSGVPSLDAATKLFIRAHWHSTDYAGQSISQPVQYSLEKH
jgi:TonB family protein